MAKRERFEQAFALLSRVQSPADLTFEHHGDSVVASVFPAYRERGSGFESRIWRISMDGSMEQLTHGPRTDAMPRCSPVDDRLLFASEAPMVGRMSLFMLQPGSPATQLGDIAGSVQDARWTADGRSVIALAVDEGGFGAATDGAVRLRWELTPPDPHVFRRNQGWRRLYRVRTADGMTEEVGPRDISVWEFDLIDDAYVVALVSDDPSESGWYRTRLAVLDLDARTMQDLWIPARQLQGPAVDPSKKRAAVLEGWSSDRGLVAGYIRIIDIGSGEALPFEPGLSDITSVGWQDPESLWFAGWRDFGSNFGVVGLDGTVRWAHSENAIVGPTSFHAGIDPHPDGTRLFAIREAPMQPVEVMRRPARDEGEWEPVTALNADLLAEVAAYPEVREMGWAGAGGLPIQGLLLVPEGEPPFPTVVVIHGGPTWGWKHGFDPGHSLPLAAAGYAILLANYRGSTGRGQEFTRLNVGDPAGAEFEDIMKGVDRCIADGIAEPGRIGVTGVSYGGYLTAWAATTTDRFAAAVMVSGITDMLSCHLTCNHAFSEFMFEGDHRDPASLALFMERSPITHAANATTPTLILHGSEDLCTPLGQAEELFQALVLNDVDTELVVYPREGHGFREREHAADAARRTLDWFDRYLEGPR